MQDLHEIVKLKEKEAKRKQKVKGLMPIGLTDKRTIGEGSTQHYDNQMPIAPEVNDLHDHRLKKKARLTRQLKNFEIDEFLFICSNQGLIATGFEAYFAKACHTLGLERIARLKHQSLEGREPQKLFAYKVKGALQLHFKRIYDNESNGAPANAPTIEY